MLRIAGAPGRNEPSDGTTMPCFLFTYHGYGTWMPDRREGFVQRGKGVVPTDPRLATTYRENQRQATVDFDHSLQKRLIEFVRESCRYQACRTHFVATDPTHVHVLTSWRSERSWFVTRRQIRSTITHGLNRQIGRRPWLAKGGSRRQVGDEQHFDYLVNKYLATHRGWKWCERRGLFL